MTTTNVQPTKGQKPMAYGPYKITPPSPGTPIPMWHVNGPALDMGSTSEQSVRMRAIEANAIYNAGMAAALTKSAGGGQ